MVNLIALVGNISPNQATFGLAVSQNLVFLGNFLLKWLFTFFLKYGIIGVV